MSTRAQADADDETEERKDHGMPLGQHGRAAGAEHVRRRIEVRTLNEGAEANVKARVDLQVCACRCVRVSVRVRAC